MLGSSKITLPPLYSDEDPSCPLLGMVRTPIFIPICICPSTLRAWSLEWVRLHHSETNFLAHHLCASAAVSPHCSVHHKEHSHALCRAGCPRKCKAALPCSLIFTEGKQFPHIMERLQESQESLYIITTIPTPVRVERIKSSTQYTITTISNNSVWYSGKRLLNRSALQWHLLGVSGTGRQNRPNIWY